MKTIVPPSEDAEDWSIAATGGPSCCSCGGCRSFGSGVTVAPSRGTASTVDATNATTFSDHLVESFHQEVLHQWPVGPLSVI